MIVRTTSLAPAVERTLDEQDWHVGVDPDGVANELLAVLDRQHSGGQPRSACDVAAQRAAVARVLVRAGGDALRVRQGRRVARLLRLHLPLALLSATISLAPLEECNQMPAMIVAAYERIAEDLEPEPDMT